MVNHTYKVLIFWVLILGIICDAPIPKCKSGFFYQTLPLTADEASIINLDRLFDGYNLSFAFQGTTDIKKLISLKDKVILQKREVPDQQLTGLKNGHLQKFNNVWGSSFIVLTEKGTKSIVHYGVLNSNTSAPVVNNVIIVQNNPNITCFDAILFPQNDLILIDCSKRLTSLNDRGQIIQNMIYYHKLSDGSFMSTLKTQMYVNFTQMNKRKLQIYSDPVSKHTFLLRAYLESGVDGVNSDNTYIDIFMISDPKNPWIVEIVDRSFLRSTTLRIRQIKVYLGNIYILDSQKGLYRVRITSQEDLQILGQYEGKGFTRFDVYSNNLDDSFQIILSNDHAVYEVDWSKVNQPRLINKYSLMEGSQVSKIMLNSRFVIVQSTSKLNETQFNYTWVFTRGSRTYTSAFFTIPHATSDIFIDLNEDMSYLIVVDPTQMINYAIDASNLILRLKYDEDMLDKMFNFTIKGSSKDAQSQQLVTCSITINFTLLEDNNRTMWPIGIAPSSDYIANYPGRVVIPLYEYVLGPNVTYKIRETEQGQLKRAKVFQNQQLKILWQTSPSTAKTIFLKTQSILSDGRNTLIIYMQDNNNITYVSYCLPDKEAIQVYCNETIKRDLGAQLTNWVTSIFISRYSLRSHHVIGYTTKKHLNRIYLIDLTNAGFSIQFDVGKGFAGQITSIQMGGRYMFVALKYIKTVQVYDLQLCLENLCEPIYTIDHLLMYRLGVKYFSPVSVHTSIYHPDTIFLKSADSVVALDVDKEGVPLILATIRPVPNAQTQFNFRMNALSMIVTIYPNIVIEYDLSRLYYREVTQVKKYPLYGFKLPRDYVIDTSDYGNCVFISTINDGGGYFVYVYRSGVPAVGSLLNIVQLNTFNNILIDATGSNIDFITVVTTEQIKIFRQHQLPLAQIDSVGKDFNFYLQYSNAAGTAVLQLINVQIINLPNYINVNPFVNNIMNTKNLLYSGENILSEIDDSDWYTGNVLRIQPQCRDCENVVFVNNHINEEIKTTLVRSMTEYQWNPDGGVLQQTNNLINLFNNGSVKSIASIPNIDGTTCYTAAVTYRAHYHVSGCVSVKGIDLYLISMVSHKPYVFQSFPSRAVSMLRLEAINQLIMLVDTNSNPFFKTSPGGVAIYTIDEDFGSESSLYQIEYFDANDLGDSSIPVIYIVNAHLTYSFFTDTYKLFITDITRGVFILELKYVKSDRELITIQVNHIDIPKILKEQHKKIPYDATYQAVTLLQSTHNQTTKQVTEKIIVTTGVYHTLQFVVVYNKAGLLTTVNLTRVYLRYAFYVVDNYVKANNGLFVVRQSLPYELDDGKLNKQLLTVYDTRGQFNGTIDERGLTGAYITNDTLLHNFDFNFTFNESDGHSEPRIGLVMVQSFSDKYVKLSLHRNLTVFTKAQVDTQIIYIDLINDFTMKKIRILLNGKSPFPQWLIIVIVLSSIIGAGILGVATYFIILKVKQRRGQNLQERDSLISDNY